MIQEEFRAFLKQKGADIVGFANLNGLEGLPLPGMTYGAAVGTAVSREIIKGIENGPNREYFEEYTRLNNLLNDIVTAGASFLRQRGFNAYAQTTDVVGLPDSYITPLPHKTVANLAGLGWIGKSALLITKEYGSAVRISSLITDAVFDCPDSPQKPRCGNCSKCSECFCGAIKGNIWDGTSDRERLVDANKCAKTANALCVESFGTPATICGKCIYVCPYTSAYISQLPNF